MAKLTGIKGLEIKESTVAWEPTIYAEEPMIPTIISLPRAVVELINKTISLSLFSPHHNHILSAIVSPSIQSATRRSYDLPLPSNRHHLGAPSIT